MPDQNKVQPGPLLKTINYPEELRELDYSQLPQLCKELRQYLIDHNALYGGHFGGSLGAVELTVALHYMFKTPNDLLVWDVGHQAYGHKILTGRRQQLHTIRKYKGLSGFPKIGESKYDTFGVGHSSTSISAALGMATASKYKGYDDRQHIALIGDGAMTAGLAFEALNNAGVSNTNILVVLNDNSMSIDPNVGALKEYLTDISTSRTYNKLRNEIWDILGKMNKMGADFQRRASKIEASLKSVLSQHSNFFESLNFRYFGPTDGHNVKHLVNIFKDLKTIDGPKLLHCRTTKGKGYKYAEQNQTSWHATKGFIKATGESRKSSSDKPSPPKYQDVFGETIIELAEENDKIMGVTPAMPSGSSLKYMMKEMPDRAFDVGIAEQHSVTFSAGLATQGLRPFCNVYSTFLQRAYDQVIHDVAIQNLPVIFCLDRAGLVSGDGTTHHGAYDMAYLRCLPNMVVSAPMTEPELRHLMYTAQLDKVDFPFSMRYPRGKGVTIDWKQPMKEIEIGTGRKLRDGQQIAILTIGKVGNYAHEACEQLNNEDLYPAHYDMRFIKPLDQDLLHEVFQQFDKIVTVEDGCIPGGFGSAILEFMADHGYQAQVKRLGIPDRPVMQGKPEKLHKECGYDPEGIMKAVREMVDHGVKVKV